MLRRSVKELFYFVQNLLLLVPLVVLIELIGYNDSAEWGVAIGLAPIALSYISGRASRHLEGLSRVIPVMVLSGVLCGALTYLILSSFPLPGSVFLAVLSLIGSAALFHVFRIGYPGLSYVRLTVGIVSYALIAVMVFFNDAFLFVSLPMNLCGLAFLLFGLLSVNRISLRHNIRPGQDENDKITYPGNLRRGNTFLLLGFFLISVVVAWFGEIKNAAIALMRGLIMAVQGILSFLGSIWTIGTAQPVPGDVEETLPEAVGDAPEWTILAAKIIAVIFGVLLAALVLYELTRGAIYLYKRLKAYFKALTGRMSSQGADYTDETESLFSWDAVRLHSRSAVDSILARLRRPDRFSDQPDNRMKVRFVYRRLVALRKAVRPDIVFKTPDELTYEPNLAPPSVDRDVLSAFVGAYDIARYSRSDVSDHDAEVARQVLDTL